MVSSGGCGGRSMKVFECLFYSGKTLNNWIRSCSAVSYRVFLRFSINILFLEQGETEVRYLEFEKEGPVQPLGDIS